MIILRNIALLCASSTLVACATTTVPVPDPFDPAVSGTAGEAAGVYSVTQDGTTTTLPGASNGSVNGMLYWDTALDIEGWAYDDGDALAISGRNKSTGDNFAGISGTLAASIATTGMATYAGGFGFNYDNGTAENAWGWGAFSTDVDFGSGEVSGTGTGANVSSLTISGDIEGMQFNGVAVVDATGLVGGSAIIPMTGGFYGTDTIAGIYQSDEIAGQFHGTNP